MLVLTVRTDKPDAEIGLFDDAIKLEYVTWQAHRQLAETLHSSINELLSSRGKTLRDVQGIVGYQGPGSFTGLRIGLTVVNALGYGLGIPTVGAMGDDWIAIGCRRLQAAERDGTVMPEYGAPVHITTPKK